MKLIRMAGEKFELEFAGEEKALLLHVLNLYPLVPESHHQISQDKKLPQRDENQHLLDEALKTHREQNKKEIASLLNAPGRFTGDENGSRATFTRGEMEWLLQVLNDVRVGCWIALGSPGYEDKGAPVPHDKVSRRRLMFMEIAGAFEMFFLGAVNGRVPPETHE